MSRESLARVSTSSDLGWSDTHQKDVDIITALGIIQLRDSRMLRLGRLLILLRGYEEARSKTDLQDRMVTDREDAKWLIGELVSGERKHREMSRSAIEKLSSAAYTEFVYDRCRQCHGAGKIMHEDRLVMTCEACAGAGKHRFSDHERADNIGCAIDKLLHYHQALYFAIAVCGTAERLAVSEAENVLGRWTK